MAKKANDNQSQNETPLSKVPTPLSKVPTPLSKVPTPLSKVPTPEEIQALKDLVEKAKNDLKAAKNAEKGIKPKKELKGTMVTFKNKAEETITGLGNLYYVVRSGGKLHYKEMSQVHVLTPEEIEALPKKEDKA